MEYCRRKPFTTFYFNKGFKRSEFSDSEILRSHLKRKFHSLEGGEYYFISFSSPEVIDVTFYFYNETDLLLAKLSI